VDDQRGPVLVNPRRRQVTTDLVMGVVGVLLIAAAFGSPARLSVVFAPAIFPAVALVLNGLRVVLYRQPAARVPVPAGAAEGTDDGLDASSRVLLRRAQDAIAAVTSSEVCRAGLLDSASVNMALADQESDIAAALRDQARIRARRAELAPASPGPMTAAVVSGQIHAAQLAESSLASRVEALERYAAEVREADAAYRDWKQAASGARR
jgi:hypothetical protein